MTRGALVARVCDGCPDLAEVRQRLGDLPDLVSQLASRPQDQNARLAGLARVPVLHLLPLELLEHGQQVCERLAGARV